MLDNDKLNRRLKRIFKELKERWRLTPYRIALETGIPHSSLKYMVDGKFEWKLNHMLSVVDFLNRYGAKVSLTDLLDFENKKSLSEILNIDKADFRNAIIQARIKLPNKFKLAKLYPEHFKIKESKPVDNKKEAETLFKDIVELVKEDYLGKMKKVSLKMEINGKNFTFKKSIEIGKGKK